MRVDVQYTGESWGKEWRQYMYHIISCFTYVYTCTYTFNLLLNVDEGAKKGDREKETGQEHTRNTRVCKQDDLKCTDINMYIYEYHNNNYTRIIHVYNIIYIHDEPGAC